MFILLVTVSGGSGVLNQELEKQTMKTHFIIVIIVSISTQSCKTSSLINNEDNIATPENSHTIKAEYFKNNPSDGLEYEFRVQDEQSRNNGFIRFEGDSPGSHNTPHFFPTEPDTEDFDETNNIGIHNDIKQKPFHYKEGTQNNDYKLQNFGDQEINSINKELANTATRIVFEDTVSYTNTENSKPIVNKKRKSRRKQRRYPLDPTRPPNQFNYVENSIPGNRPGFPLYQPGFEGLQQGYGLYPGPPINQNRPVNPPLQAQYDQTGNLNNKYSDQYSGLNSGGPVSPGIQTQVGYQHQGGYPGSGTYGFGAYPNAHYGLYPLYPGLQGYPVPQHRPQSLTEQAVSAVSKALTSIALYDDKQCVPRLLCEVASGRASGSNTLLKAAAGLGPLLSILQSYNSASSSPLFHFGRAAVLGMTSTGNTISCYRAYPDCPRDPTELVNYLNNHNGGFFRFFGQPGPEKQQNLEQFYNHLAGQNTQQQNYAYNYGYSNQYPKNNEVKSNRRIVTVINLNKTDDVFNDTQERIQNKPSIEAEDENTAENSKWTFPDDKRRRPRKQKYEIEDLPFGDRGGNHLKFPDDRNPIDYVEKDKVRDYIQKQQVNFFPSENDINETKYQVNTVLNSVDLEKYVFDYKHNFYVKRPKYANSGKDEGHFVYILRGNGDPNHPEVVKVKPGYRT